MRCCCLSAYLALHTADRTSTNSLPVSCYARSGLLRAEWSAMQYPTVVLMPRRGKMLALLYRRHLAAIMEDAGSPDQRRSCILGLASIVEERAMIQAR